MAAASTTRSTRAATGAGTPPSSLQIVRNYQNAAKAIGGQVLYENSLPLTCIRVAKNGKETWVEVYPVNGGAVYQVLVIERQAMQQDVIANAKAFQSGLKESGHVAVPGIYFDFGKSDVKPESGPALKEIVTLLRTNARAAPS